MVSFYSFLEFKPAGRFVIRLCRTIACDMLGKDKVATQLETTLGLNLAKQLRWEIYLEWANCMGMCDQGPALLVNDRVFTRVTPDKVTQILEACRKAFGIYALGSIGEGHL